jgi:hypothetical protein
MPDDDQRKTWGWIEQKGRSCFERRRRRDNRTHTLGVLSGTATEAAEFKATVPGVVGDGEGAKGCGKWGQGGDQQATNAGDPRPWLNAAEPDNPQNTNAAAPRRPPVIRAAEQRAANGPCWYYTTGACKKTNCSKERRVVSDAERANIPAVFVDRNLPQNAKGGAADSAWTNSQSDAETYGNFEVPEIWALGEKMPRFGCRSGIFGLARPSP